MQGFALFGTAEVVFHGPVRQANGEPAPGLLTASAFSVYVSGGNLIIKEGSALRVAQGRAVFINGGKLATRVTAGAADHTATIVGNLQVGQGEVVICDPSLNPPEETGFVFGKLEVWGNVWWYGGTYRPLINPTGEAPSSVQWSARGSFMIGELGSPAPVLGPHSGATPPPLTVASSIITAGNGIAGGTVIRTVTPTFEALNTNWTILESFNPHKLLAIKRTV